VKDEKETEHKMGDKTKKKKENSMRKVRKLESKG
jgi:hypothetical protein